MKAFILLFNLFASLAYGQNLIGEWHSPEVLWKDAKEQYSLRKPSKERPMKYGTFIVFKENKTFESYYSAPCGNGCFPSSTGNYRLIGKNKVELIVNKIAKDGMCGETSQRTHFEEKGIWKLGVYHILINSEGIELKQIQP